MKEGRDNEINVGKLRLIIFVGVFFVVILSIGIFKQLMRLFGG